MHKELFLLKLEAALLPLPEKERMEIVEEYDAHFEFSKQEGRTEEEIAKELGVPEELAADILNDQRERKPETLSEIPVLETEPKADPYPPMMEKPISPAGDDRSALAPRKSAPVPISEYMRVPPMDYRSDKKEESSPPALDAEPNVMGAGMQASELSAQEPMTPPSFYAEQGRDLRMDAPPMHGFEGPHNQNQAPPFAEEPPKKKRSAGGAIGVLIVSIVVIPLLLSFWGVFISLGAAALIMILSPALLIVKLYMGGMFHGIDLSAVLIMFGLGIFLMQLVWPLMKGYSKISGGYMRWVFNIRKERAA